MILHCLYRLHFVYPSLHSQLDIWSCFPPFGCKNMYSCFQCYRSGIATSYGDCLVFWGTTILFISTAEPFFAFPATIRTRSNFSTFSPVLGSFCLFLFDKKHPTGYEMISHCGFDSICISLLTCDVEHLSICIYWYYLLLNTCFASICSHSMNCLFTLLIQCPLLHQSL